MKILIIAFALLLTGVTTAQNIAEIHNTIEVNSSVNVDKEVIGYRVKIILSLDQLGYGVSDCNSFEELKERYFKKLKEKGIDTDKFKESKIEYLTMYFQKDGTVYNFETKSKEDISKVLSTRINGVSTNSFEYQIDIDNIEYDVLYEEALQKATDKAKKIALKSKRKIGKIAKVTDNSSYYKNWVYYNPQDEFLQFTITFEML